MDKLGRREEITQEDIDRLIKLEAMVKVAEREGRVVSEHLDSDKIKSQIIENRSRKQDPLNNFSDHLLLATDSFNQQLFEDMLLFETIEGQVGNSPAGWRTDITANWIINEMKQQWSKATTETDKLYWANQADSLRQRLRMAGYSDSDIMQASDNMIPEDIVMMIAELETLERVESDPFGIKLYVEGYSFWVPDFSDPTSTAITGTIRIGGSSNNLPTNGMGDAWRNKIILPDTPHTNKTPGHWEAMVEIAEKLAQQDDVVRVYLNKGLSNEIPGVKPNRRPDVLVVREDGKIDQYEIPSKTDNIDDLLERMRDNQRLLGDKAGDIYLLPPKD